MPETERVQQSTPTTLSQQWYENGVAVDPGTVTVGIVRWDGTELVAPGTSTGGTLTAARTFNLTTTHTALLDRLKVTWTGTLKGTLVSYVEVVGGFLFSIAEALALPGLASTPAADIVATRIRAEQILERRLHDAFVPRYRRETLVGDGGCGLLLSMPRVRTIRSISIDGTALSAGDLALLTVGPYLITGRRWCGNITVGYEHGWDAPEEPIRQATLAMARFYLTTAPGQEGVDPRVRYITTPEGRIDYGADGLGLPEVDRAIALYDMNLGVA